MARRGHGGHGEESVSAVVGTVLVLGISVMGIGAVLFWGAPLIQEMQDRSAQGAMLAEFLEVRDAVSKLTGADSSRSLGIGLTGGELALTGTESLLVGIDEDATCSWDIDAWADAAEDQFKLVPTGTCADDALTCSGGGGEWCLSVYTMDGATLTEIASTYDAGADGVDLSPSSMDIDATDHHILIYDQDTGTPVYEAWIVSSARLTWEKSSSEGTRRLHYVWGAVLSETSGAVFAEAQFQATEDAFQSGDYYLRANALESTGVSVSGTDQYGLFVSLASLESRTTTTSSYTLRYEFAGDLSESLCNTVALRDATLDTSSYSDCTTDTDGLPAITYTPPSTPFRMEFLHAQVPADIQI